MAVATKTPKSSTPDTTHAYAKPPKFTVSNISLSTTSIPFLATLIPHFIVFNPHLTVSSHLLVALKPSLTISLVVSSTFLRFFQNPNKGMSYTVEVGSLTVSIVDLIRKNSNYLYPDWVLIGNTSVDLADYTLPEDGEALHIGWRERVQFRGEIVEAIV